MAEAFVWRVLIHDFNAKQIKPYNALSGREAKIKQLKKRGISKEEFADLLKRDFMSQYWSRAEYEMILYIENDKVYLEPWIGDLQDGRVDVTGGSFFDWPAFAEHMLAERAWYNKERNIEYVKFDIYDQLMFRFDEVVNYCWNFRHKYQRRRKDD